MLLERIMAASVNVEMSGDRPGKSAFFPDASPLPVIVPNDVRQGCAPFNKRVSSFQLFNLVVIGCLQWAKHCDVTGLEFIGAMRGTAA
jgi:hypothetical protein